MLDIRSRLGAIEEVTKFGEDCVTNFNEKILDLHCSIFYILYRTGCSEQ